MHRGAAGGYGPSMTQQPDPTMPADDQVYESVQEARGSDADGAQEVSPDAPADAPEVADPAHGPVPDGSPLSGSDPIGTAATKP